MTRGLEILLKGDFGRIVGNYVERFPDSFEVYGSTNGGTVGASYDDVYQQYLSALRDNAEATLRVGAADMFHYLNLYNVHLNQHADEFKIIYYFGRAIERQLRHLGLDQAAQIHLFSMLAMLEFRLRTRGYIKRDMIRAVANLIKQRKLDEELGRNGCYLLFKCVSTTAKEPVPGAPS